MTATYLVPLRVACDGLVACQWIEGLYTNRVLREAHVVVVPTPAPSPDVGALLVAKLTGLKSQIHTLLDTVLLSTTARVLIYARLNVHGRATTDDLGIALRIPSDVVLKELETLAGIGLVRRLDDAWTACAWSQGGEA